MDFDIRRDRTVNFVKQLAHLRLDFIDITDMSVSTSTEPRGAAHEIAVWRRANTDWEKPGITQRLG